jgi:hypothetical protein
VKEGFAKASHIPFTSRALFTAKQRLAVKKGSAKTRLIQQRESKQWSENMLKQVFLKTSHLQSLQYAFTQCKSTRPGSNNHPEKRYNTDSKLIQINNCASYSISFDKNDFINPLKPVKQKVKECWKDFKLEPLS